MKSEPHLPDSLLAFFGRIRIHWDHEPDRLERIEALETELKRFGKEETR